MTAKIINVMRKRMGGGSKITALVVLVVFFFFFPGGRGMEYCPSKILSPFRL